MSYIGNVVEILKTTKGKLFAALLALAVIFTFTGIAYGTSAVSVLNSDEPTVQSEEAPTVTVAAESEQPEAPSAPDPSEGTVTPVVTPSDDEVAEQEEEPVITGPTVEIYGMVQFDFDSSHGWIECGDNGDAWRVEVDPATITPATPFTFTVNPTSGYAVKSVSLVSTFDKRAIPVEVEEGKEVSEKAVLVSDLTPDMIKALENTSEITIPSDQMDGTPVGNTNSMTYEIGDMRIFAGRDVVITIETEEIHYDSWYKIVQALAEGEDVKLSDNVKTETDVDEPEATEEEIELKNKLNRESAVVKPGTAPTLDLNGFKIESTFTDKPLFKVEGEGTALTIKDDASAPIYGGAGTKSAAAADAGREAKWENGTLTYYVTSTVASTDPSTPYETSETCFVQTVTVPREAGAIAGRGSNLIESTAGALVNITGGVLSNANGAVVNSNRSKLDMTGGFIVGSSISKDNGAGINAASSDVHIGGKAVIAGNTASAVGTTGGNGGGMALFAVGGNSCNATIDGNAIIAGNKANGVETPGSDNRPRNGLGGGIYTFAAASSPMNLSISGNAVVSGNVAQCDGGGIYQDGNDLKLPSTVTVAGSAYITNNRTTFAPRESSKDGIDPITTGGGGICALYALVIEGNAKITGNYSADGGGGIFMPKKNGQQNAMLTMNSGFFAANYADKSEGGAMHLTTLEGSVIYSGHITNNATNTTYDYGGGGIFVVSKGRDGGKPGNLKLRNPLITKNSAVGSGGGVAACQNGIVISSDAAIFDNEATGEAVPTGHSVGSALGAQWPSELGKPSDNGIYLANDFYGAKDSKIYNDMLGVNGATGSYNWKGFMSGSPYDGIYDYIVNVTSFSTLAPFTITRADGTVVLEGNLGELENGAWFNGSKTAVALFIADDNGKNIHPFAGLSDQSEAEIKSFLNSIFSTRVLLKQGSTCYEATMLLDSSSKYANDPYKNAFENQTANKNRWAVNLKLKTVTDYQYGGNIYNADGSINTDWSYIGDITAKDTSYNGSFKAYKFIQFPRNETINGEYKASHVEALRFLGLTAFPRDDDQANAIAAAKVYVSGNTSSANGGGIGVNGIITIGRDPGEDPDDPPTPERFGSLNISKVFVPELADAPAGKATVLFKVAGYTNKQAYQNNVTNPSYSNVLAAEYEKSSDGTITMSPIILKNLPVDSYFIIEEIMETGFNTSFSGVSFEGSNIEQLGDKTVGITIVANEKDADGNVIRILNTVAFTDTYDPDKPYNDSVINKWGKDGWKGNNESAGSEE